MQLNGKLAATVTFILVIACSEEPSPGPGPMDSDTGEPGDSESDEGSSEAVGEGEPCTGPGDCRTGLICVTWGEYSKCQDGLAGSPCALPKHCSPETPFCSGFRCTAGEHQCQRPEDCGTILCAASPELCTSP